MAESLWPWLAVAAVGALHGLNPTSGWMLAAAWGVKSGDRRQALRALLPLAAGHLASVALVAATVLPALAMDRRLVQMLAGGLLVVAVVLCLVGRRFRWRHAPVGHAGLALWSFMMSTAHGAGLMLVPALAPLCFSGGTKGGAIATSGSLALAVAAVGIHTAAMVLVAGAMAVGACRGFDAVAALRWHPVHTYWARIRSSWGRRCSAAVCHSLSSGSGKSLDAASQSVTVESTAPSRIWLRGMPASFKAT